MGLIPCNENCIYQNDGYCQLETTAIVTTEANKSLSGCAHYIDRSLPETNPPIPEQKRQP